MGFNSAFKGLSAFLTAVRQAEQPKDLFYTFCTVHCVGIDVYNQIYLHHNIYTSGVSESATYFGTLQMPSSGSPLGR